ncbi:MAG: MFS transporter [Corynebacterium sp.]|uniref:MFS transporter n=1 Tax=Corynebacterium TaxID=1716 RepID=UPI00264A4DF7|nr:MFS transporter [Corynebacterium sp.]MDN5721652.1 MFS transporter [Corynebacterium sp.]MDN6283039.1 MFS transporter [Corynebacterium sp.]MDN6306213.1 MFS transporter [Corynebacterium sp.]MDN6353544.1 MFS transporter [Corynebacterium sp.]MDN6367819.1 MFS transporter [Corynebacterium sp.]
MTPQSRTATSPQLTRTERLDRLPVTKRHTKLLGGSGIGWALDAMDVGLIGFIMAALTTHWGLTHTETSWLASAGFVGMALGATFGGLLADRFGRRNIFAVTLLVYGLATGASALAGGLAVLIALRFVVGLGLGAELPVASTLISEYAPRKVRGRMVVILEAFWAVGWLAAAVIGAFVVPVGENGWRWALALGMVPAFYALYVRMKLPESVRFLESKGRHEEAEEIVAEFEASEPTRLKFQAENADGASDSSQVLDEKQLDAAILAGSDGASAPVTSIWAAPLRRRTAALWTIWFCINLSYYGAFTWIPSILVDQGFSLVKSFTFTLIITLAQLPGYAVAAFLIERWGRRATLAAFLAGSAVAAGLYGPAGQEWQIIAAGCLLSFFNLGAWGALYAIGPELYPTTMRARGTGAATGFGRLASIIAPLIVPPLLVFGGLPILFTLFGIAFAIAALAALALPELKGTRLLEK